MLNKAAYKPSFRPGEFRWNLGVRGADAEAFFTPQDSSGKLLGQKRAALLSRPELYLSETPAAQPLVDAAWELAMDWGHALEPEGPRTLAALAQMWEPDLLLVARENLEMVAGAVCFPSSWDPRGAVGKPVFDVHGVVPGLNGQLGDKVEKFLGSLTAGKAYARMNWSLTRSEELDYHPGIGRRKLDGTVTLEELHLRIEHQLFCAVGDGVMMGLRIEPIPLLHLTAEVDIWEGLREKVRTMPEDVARYKGMESAREAILGAMDGADALIGKDESMDDQEMVQVAIVSEIESKP